MGSKKWSVKTSDRNTTKHVLVGTALMVLISAILAMIMATMVLKALLPENLIKPFCFATIFIAVLVGAALSDNGRSKSSILTRLYATAVYVMILLICCICVFKEPIENSLLNLLMAGAGFGATLLKLQVSKNAKKYRYC